MIIPMMFVTFFVIVVVLFFFQAEDGIRDYKVTGVQTCALPISAALHLHQQLRAVCLVPHRLRHHRAGDGLHGPGQLERRLSTAVPSMGTSHLRVAFFSAWASGLTRMTGAWLPRENPCTSENEDVLWL